MYGLFTESRLTVIERNMLRSCIICYRLTPVCSNSTGPCGTEERTKKMDAGKLQLFFRLFRRHVDDHEDANLWFSSVERVINGGLLPCEECSKLVESFCELQHQMKSIELLLNWKMEALKNIMSCAQRVPSRVEDLRRSLTQLDIEDCNADDIIGFKRNLVKKCRQKLRRTFPRLVISKYDPPEKGQEPEPEQRASSISSIFELNCGAGESTNLKHETDYAETLNQGVVGDCSLEADEIHSPTAENIPTIMATGTTSPMSHRMSESEDSEADYSNDTVEGGVEEIEPSPQMDITVPPPNTSSLPDSSKAVDRNDGSEIILTPPDRRRLRTVHRCSICNRTFSNGHRLTQHKKSECINREENYEDGDDDNNDKAEAISNESSDSDTEDPLKAKCDGDDDADYSFDLVDDKNKSSDEDMEFDSENGDKEMEVEETEHEQKMQIDDNDESDRGDLDIKMELRLTRKRRIKKERAPQTFYRFKCPDCDQLFLHFYSLILHRKTSHGRDSNSEVASEETTRNEMVDIQILSFSTKPGSSIIPSSDSDDDKIKFKLFSTIEIKAKTEVFLCSVPNCGEPFYSSEELQSHSKLHGNFNCNFCDVTMSYAPSLAEHELQHVKKHRSNPKRNGLAHKCPRCEILFTGYDNKCSYVSHHLSAHLGLSLNNGACVICNAYKFSGSVVPENESSNWKRICGKGQHQIFNHYKTKHDKTTINSSGEELKRCPVENCPAYFLQLSQLVSHLSREHKLFDTEFHSRLRTEQTCEHCGKCFLQLAQLRSHRKNLRCQFVEKEEPEVERQIRKRIRNSSEFKCDKCNTLFNRVYKLLLHHKQGHPAQSSSEEAHYLFVEMVKGGKVFAKLQVPNELFPCPETNCKSSFYQEKDLEEHSKLHGTFPCAFCDVVKIYAPDLARHELEHKNTTVKYTQKLWDCPRCEPPSGTGRTNYQDYERHHLTAHLSLPYGTFGEKCPICKIGDYRIATYHNMIAHYETQHNLQNMDEDSLKRCSLEGCSAYFLSQGGLTSHLQSFHGYDKKQARKLSEPEGSRRNWGCSDCEKCFASGTALRKHRIREHVKPWNTHPCKFDKCKMICETEVLLNEHIQLRHSSTSSGGDKLKECPKCKKMVGMGGGFIQHMNAHKRQEDIEAGRVAPCQGKKYVCEHCGKVFRAKTFLEVHYLSHSGPSSWNFMCSVCSRKFATQGNLDTHMRTHTKEKPFVCQVCGEKYAHRHNLRNHVNRLHGSVIQDVPRKVDKTNFNRKKKGLKRKNRESSSESDDDDSE